jgi:hypothetical protein
MIVVMYNAQAIAIVIGHPVAVWERGENQNLQMRPTLVLPRAGDMHKSVLHIFHEGVHYQSVVFQKGSYGSNTVSHVSISTIAGALDDEDVFIAISDISGADSNVGDSRGSPPRASSAGGEGGRGGGATYDCRKIAIDFLQQDCTIVDEYRCMGPQEICHFQDEIPDDRTIVVADTRPSRRRRPSSATGDSESLLRNYLVPTPPVNQDEILFTHFNIPVNKGTILRLRDKQWINDEVIDFYSYYLWFCFSSSY